MGDVLASLATKTTSQVSSSGVVVTYQSSILMFQNRTTLLERHVREKHCSCRLQSVDAPCGRSSPAYGRGQQWIVRTSSTEGTLVVPLAALRELSPRTLSPAIRLVPMPHHLGAVRTGPHRPGAYSVIDISPSSLDGHPSTTAVLHIRIEHSGRRRAPWALRQRWVGSGGGTDSARPCGAANRAGRTSGIGRRR